jgi:hypothetical protein
VQADDKRHSRILEHHIFCIMPEACQNAVKQSNAKRIVLSGRLDPQKTHLTTEMPDKFLDELGRQYVTQNDDQIRKAVDDPGSQNSPRFQDASATNPADISRADGID